jgi:fibro-slime domain-containing protein
MVSADSFICFARETVMRNSDKIPSNHQGLSSLPNSLLIGQWLSSRPLALALVTVIMSLGACNCGESASETDPDPEPSTSEDKPDDTPDPVSNQNPIPAYIYDEEGKIKGINIQGIVRDFNAKNPIDFENPMFANPNVADLSDQGIVKNTLGEDKKPAYGDHNKTDTTSGKDNFDKWYNTYEGINKEVPMELTLLKGDNEIFTFSDEHFFPIDNEGFGNQEDKYEDCDEDPRNFHFTLEVHTSFTYHGGETFSFMGDDDLWVFVDGQLVIDLGGIHNQQKATFDLDKKQTSYSTAEGDWLYNSELFPNFSFEKGSIHNLDLFFAERHVCASRFRIDTSLKLAPQVN